MPNAAEHYAVWMDCAEKDFEKFPKDDAHWRHILRAVSGFNSLYDAQKNDVPEDEMEAYLASR